LRYRAAWHLADHQLTPGENQWTVGSTYERRCRAARGAHGLFILLVNGIAIAGVNKLSLRVRIFGGRASCISAPQRRRLACAQHKLRCLARLIRTSNCVVGRNKYRAATHQYHIATFSRFKSLLGRYVDVRMNDMVVRLAHQRAYSRGFARWQVASRQRSALAAA